MIDIYKPKKYDKEVIDLSEFEPENDYILVIGTSHSCGVCEIYNKGQKFIQEERLWCNQLADKMGLDVFNISVAGHRNLFMQTSLNDYFDHYTGDKCKMIIAEVRQHEGGFQVARDVVEDYNFDNQEYRNKMLPSIAEGRDILFKNVLSRALMSDLVINYGDDRHKLALDVATHAAEATPAPTAIKNVEKIIDVFSDILAPSGDPYIRDMICVQSMSSLAKAHKKPFYWFGWDRSFYDLGGKNQVDHALKQTTKIFDYKLNCFEDSAVDSFTATYGWQERDKQSCDCGHFKAPVHDFVAKQIYKEIA